jgi:hypothetical protein
MGAYQASKSRGLAETLRLSRGRRHRGLGGLPVRDDLAALETSEAAQPDHLAVDCRQG